MNNVDKQYLDILQDILDNGNLKHTRAGDALSVFGRTMRFDLQEGLPLLTTKKVFYRGCIEELIWFLKGDTNIKYLVEKNVNIWTDDAYRYYTELVQCNNEITTLMFPDSSASRQVTMSKAVTKDEFVKNVLEGKTEKFLYMMYDTSEEKLDTPLLKYRFGDLGPVYGKQMRHYGVSGLDQIQNIIDKIKNNPDDRRILYTNYNPDVLDEVALPACHLLYQFYVTPSKKGNKARLSCSFVCRSQDYTTGTPFNILQAALLTHILAEICDLDVGELIYLGNDVHVYCNHIEGAREQLGRKGSERLAHLRFSRKITDINDLRYEDFVIEDYNPDPAIKFQLNVG